CLGRDRGTMLRITKATDYGIILLTTLAAEPARMYNAAQLALEAGIPMPMASKILKRLARGHLLASQRGAKGGYVLTRHPREITVAEIIDALEGPVALTECIALGPGCCEQEPACPTQTNWRRINVAIHDALAGITLEEMRLPLPRGYHRDTAGDKGQDIPLYA
ncbi:MAG: SUF system Fe-S cluster assembly regulator, partial [Anaerolineae bacterium]